MRAGNLRHKIVLQQKTVDDNTYGQSIPTWTDQIITYAAIWPLRGVEKMESLKLDNEVSHKIRIRYQKDAHPKMRIKFGERYFNILSIINPDERNIYQEIMAMEEV